MIWRRALLVLTLAIVGLALETSVFGQATLVGAKPELLVLITVAIAMADGPAFGAITGFVLGMLTDSVLPLPQGVSALTFTIAGYTVGRVRAQVQRPSAWLPIIMVSVSTFLSVLLYAALTFVIGRATLSPLHVVRDAALAGLYNALLTPFVFPALRVLCARMRPRSSEVLR